MVIGRAERWHSSVLAGCDAGVIRLCVVPYIWVRLRMRVGCIGYGTIGQRVVLGLAAPPVAVLVRRPRGERDSNFVYSVDELVSADPEVVIEAASPDALAQYALPIVSSGRTLIAASGAGLRN